MDLQVPRTFHEERYYPLFLGVERNKGVWEKQRNKGVGSLFLTAL